MPPERRVGDVVVALALGLFAGAAIYAPLALRLAGSPTFFDAFNLLFDLDPGGYSTTLTAPWGGPAGQHGVLKHPLFQVYAVLAWPWLWAGFAPHAAAGLATASAGGLAVALFHGTALTLGTPRLDAALVTALFALTAGQLFAAFIVESYAFAVLSLALMWFVAARRFRDPARHRRLAAVVAALVFGTTLTNVVQAAIAEATIRCHHFPWRRALRGLVRFGIAAGAVALAGLILLHADDLLATAEQPVDALKRIYWTRTKGEASEVATLLLTFFVYGYAGPEFTSVPLPEGIVMRDFRAFLFPAPAVVAIVLWLALFVAGSVLALADRRLRPFAAALALALAVNVALHLDYQFRGSLFLYVPHFWFAVMMLVATGFAALAARQVDGRWRLAARATLVAALVGAAAVNLPQAWEAASAFEAAAEGATGDTGWLGEAPNDTERRPLYANAGLGSPALPPM